MKTKFRTIKEIKLLILTDLPTVYIAGKVTGLDYETTRKKFNEAQKGLEKRGLYVLNPMEIVHKSASWEQAMRICIFTLTQADFIYTLPDYKDSKGALLEVVLAENLGIINFGEL